MYTDWTFAHIPFSKWECKRTLWGFFQTNHELVTSNASGFTEFFQPTFRAFQSLGAFKVTQDFFYFFLSSCSIRITS